MKTTIPMELQERTGQRNTKRGSETSRGTGQCSNH